LRLARARSHYNAEKDFAKIRAKVLYVLSRTDKLFPPSIAPGVMGEAEGGGRSMLLTSRSTATKVISRAAPDWQKWDRCCAIPAEPRVTRR